MTISAANWAELDGCGPASAATAEPDSGQPSAVPEPTIVTLGEFVAVDEPGAAALLGDEHGALIPEGGDVMVYGDGGAGKTTLLFDAAFHLAAGVPWLQIPVARAVRVLLVENEGPRALLRQKLRRKLAAWSGAAVDDAIRVFEQPWGKLSLAEPAWREQLAGRVKALEVDVLIAGPLTRLGMDTAGTLAEVVEFMRMVAEVREQSGRLLTVILVHHENKAGAVSGAWEGAGDTLLHVQAAGNGHTVLHVQKARWSSAHHHTTLKLRWTDGEGFELEGDRDYVAEVRDLLGDGTWRRLKEICAPADEGGIGAGEDPIRTLLESQTELFEMRTKDAARALGHDVKAKVWGLRSGPSADDAEGAFQGGGGSMSASASPLKGRRHATPPPSHPLVSAPDARRRRRTESTEADWAQALIDGENGGAS